MAGYSVTFARSARKELENLPDAVVDKILARVEQLATTPRPRGCRKLQGEKDLWRIRVGEYRVVYAIDDRRRTIDVVIVRHRRDAYR